MSIFYRTIPKPPRLSLERELAGIMRGRSTAKPRRATIRKCYRAFLIEQNGPEHLPSIYHSYSTRSALRNVLEPILIRATGCDSVSAVCAINEFMDWGWETQGPRISLGSWLVNRVRNYRIAA